MTIGILFAKLDQKGPNNWSHNVSTDQQTGKLLVQLKNCRSQSLSQFLLQIWSQNWSNYHLRLTVIQHDQLNWREKIRSWISRSILEITFARIITRGRITGIGLGCSRGYRSIPMDSCGFHWIQKDFHGSLAGTVDNSDGFSSYFFIGFL